MIDWLLSILGEKYPLTELDTEDMGKIKVKGMNFIVKAFKAENLGHVSLMKAKGFFGLMKMDTLIINPTVKDLPLYSYDRIYAMGNDTLIVELYDTFLEKCNMDALESVKEKYSDIPERNPGEHWYDNIKLPESISKKGKSSHSKRFDELAMKHLQAYLKTSVSGVDDVSGKMSKASYYVEGLLEKGGPSTDVFKEALGEEKTGKLFRDVLFGI